MAGCLAFPYKEGKATWQWYLPEYGRRAVCWEGVGWESFSIKCSFVWHYKQLYSPLGKTWRGLKKKKKTWSSVKRESELCLLNLSRASRLLFLLVMKMCSCEENPKKKKKTTLYFTLESILWLFLLPIELSSCVFLCLQSWNTQWWI